MQPHVSHSMQVSLMHVCESGSSGQPLASAHTLEPNPPYLRRSDAFLRVKIMQKAPAIRRLTLDCACQRFAGRSEQCIIETSTSHNIPGTPTRNFSPRSHYGQECALQCPTTCCPGRDAPEQIGEGQMSQRILDRTPGSKNKTSLRAPSPTTLPLLESMRLS